jgi:hypothetical protein
MANNLKFSCSALPVVNGHSVKALTPDENGCYDVVLGCVGAPTRANVIYESNSLIKAMSDPNGRFNICLKDGNLFGEWGHPVINGREDIPRLLRIDEKYISHVFMKIWVDETPITRHGIPGYPIRALVKPCGPYGDVLEKSLRDPTINTAFSIRSLCMPGTGPDSKYEYRTVQMVVTFDAVNAPGFEMATKRYNTASMESFELGVDKEILTKAVVGNSGMESSMITDRDIRKFYNDKEYTIGGKLVATNVVGGSVVRVDGNLGNAAALMYGRKNKC